MPRPGGAGCRTWDPGCRVQARPGGRVWAVVQGRLHAIRRSCLKNPKGISKYQPMGLETCPGPWTLCCGHHLGQQLLPQRTPPRASGGACADPTLGHQEPRGLWLSSSAPKPSLPRVPRHASCPEATVTAARIPLRTPRAPPQLSVAATLKPPLAGLFLPYNYSG